MVAWCGVPWRVLSFYVLYACTKPLGSVSSESFVLYRSLTPYNSTGLVDIQRPSRNTTSKDADLAFNLQCYQASHTACSQRPVTPLATTPDQVWDLSINSVESPWSVPMEILLPCIWSVVWLGVFALHVFFSIFAYFFLLLLFYFCIANKRRLLT